MKTVILAGGFGTRLSEETDVRPKPMVEVGGHPMLWHIMKLYGHFGFNNFVLALGYKADYIKRYFLEYIHYAGNLTVSVKDGKSCVTHRERDEWTISMEDTGIQTMTGGRLKHLSPLLKDGTFMLTYGDGVGNIDIPALLQHHKKMGKLATITVVRPPARYGGAIVENGMIQHFTEKPQSGEGWINGGFMVFEPDVLSMIKESGSSLEYDLLEELAKEGRLAAYRHDGFWQCMDTLRDVKYLEKLWTEGDAPWKCW